MIPRLRQIQIQSFKSFGHAVVDLEPFTALVGANGSGKTNFLDSLRFVKDCLTHSPREACESRGGSRIVPRWQGQAPERTPGRTGFLLRIDLAEGLSADYAFEIGWDGAGLPRVTHELCRVQEADREQVFEVAEGQFRREIAGIRPRIQPDRLALTIAAATEEFRPVYDFLTALQFYSILPDALRFGSSLAGGSLASSGTNAAEILLRSGEAGHERIHQLLARAVPGLREVHPHEEAGGRWGLEIKQEVGAAQLASFNAAEMSDGTLRLLGLLLALYQPDRSSLIAIEEPEATIHPAAAELVLQVLVDAAEERQVLITTHSPDVLDAKEISDEQIRVVTMTHGRTAIAPLAPASRQAIREHLYTPGELLRSNELNQDVQAAAEAAEPLDLFGEVSAGTR